MSREKGFSFDGMGIYTILKVFFLILIILFLVRQRTSDRPSSTDFDTMWRALTAAADLTPMQEADNQMLKRLYGLDPNEYEGARLYYPNTNMGAEELLLIRLSDSSQKEAISSAIQGRLATQKKSFDGYGADQTAMLENSIVRVRESFALFVSAADPGSVEKVFLENY